MLARQRALARTLVSAGSVGKRQGETMMRHAALAAAALAAGLTAPLIAQPAAHEPEARIAFVNHGGIRNFRPAGRETVYLQDRGRQWYRAELMGPCPGLPWAIALGVEPRGTSSLDRFGALIVDGQRCQLHSLVRVDAPTAS
jgi:hypothetical protein